MLGALLAGLSTAAWPPPPGTAPESLEQPGTWPNDPDFGYVNNTDPAGRKEGQWELYSFVPERSLPVPVAPAREVAAGASVDRAWIDSVGSPRAVIAIADTGIDWSEPDLVRRVRLNLGELRSATAPPLHADRSPCAPLDPLNPDVDRFDCDGDGVLTVDDYREHPDLSPRTADPPGDANGNGVLDAQDLLSQRFIANGQDDDSNGYRDDLIGWDFVDDDNDPFDTDGIGAGTAQALAALASTNDGQGRAGACPACRLLPLRVGTAGPVEPQRLGKAIAYAADQDATAVAAARDTLGTSPHLAAAVDYAWAVGTLVVTSPGDEGTRRPADPSALARTLPVGAITLGGPGADSTTATTFLAVSPCSNFGGRRLLSAPSRTCPPDGVGLVAGIAGLVRSAALAAGDTAPRVTPGELLQLLTTTADDVDVAESRSAAAALAWSQPGFDQRFGFGRVNASRAVTAVIAGRIPPEVDLTSPPPFAVLGADRVASAIDVIGKVSARRARTYDYRIEWAPGVQPEATAFRLVAERTGLAATTVSGDGTPLARLDARTIDPTHAPDPDGPHGEEATTITLRVTATAHYGDPTGDVTAELRRPLTIERDGAAFRGFPRAVVGAGAAAPQLGDLDGDGLPELVVATTSGAVHAWSFASGEARPLAGFPFQTAADGEPRGAAYGSTSGINPALLRESVGTLPAIGDVDGDGSPDLVVASRLGQLYVVNVEGELRPGWPRRLPDVERPCAGACAGPPAYRPRDLFSSPVLADLAPSPGLEILVVGFDGRVHALHGDGTAVGGWPVTLVGPDELAAFGPFDTPTVADFTGDGIPDLVTGAERIDDGTARFFLIDGRGNGASAAPLDGWPVEPPSWSLLRGAGSGARATSAAGDFDDDGRPEAVLQTTATPPWILPATPGDQELPGDLPNEALPLRDPRTGARGIEYTGRFGADATVDPSSPMVPLLSVPALGDLDQDGVLDVVATGSLLSDAERVASGGWGEGPATQLLAFWSGRTGEMLPGSPAAIEGLTWLGGAAIADLTGDDYPEMIVGTEGNLVHAIDACGREAEGWPKRTGQWVAAAPAVGDLDGDGRLEVAVVTRAGWVHLWRTDAPADAVSPWPTQRHDPANTGSMTTELPGRRARGDAPPLPIDDDGRCIPEDEWELPATPAPQLLPRGGGCDCASAPGRRDRRQGTPSGAAWLLLLVASATTRRRRRATRGGGRHR